MPYDFGKPTNIVVTTKASSGDAYSTANQLVEGVHYTLTVSDENRIRVKLRSKRATGANDSTFSKVSFNTNLPTLPTFGWFDVAVNDSEKPQLTYAFPGNAESSASTDSLAMSVYSATSLDYSAVPASRILAEMGPSLAVEAGLQSAFTVYMTVDKEPGDSGFDAMFMRAPSIFTGISGFSISMTTSSGTTSLVKGVDYTIDLSNKEFPRVLLTNLFTEEEPTLFAITFNATAPEYTGLYFFDIGVMNLANPVEFYAGWADVSPNSTRNEMSVAVKPKAGALVDQPPVDSIAAEISPNSAETDADYKGVIYIRTQQGSGQSLDTFRVVMPPMFSKSSNYSVSVGALQSARALLKDLEYSVIENTVNNSFTIKLSSEVISDGISYTTVSFSARANSYPGKGAFEVSTR
ncbi:MAG: hypothetical protein HQL31_09455, partial [Planctomycetes bacterium]|nr:hypothetical protein [Planctomycetota bacterium]